MRTAHECHAAWTRPGHSQVHVNAKPAPPGRRCSQGAPSAHRMQRHLRQSTVTGQSLSVSCVTGYSRRCTRRLWNRPETSERPSEATSLTQPQCVPGPRARRPPPRAPARPLLITDGCLCAQTQLTAPPDASRAQVDCRAARHLPLRAMSSAGFQWRCQRWLMACRWPSISRLRQHNVLVGVNEAPLLRAWRISSTMASCSWHVLVGGCSAPVL